MYFNNYLISNYLANVKNAAYSRKNESDNRTMVIYCRTAKIMLHDSDDFAAFCKLCIYLH